MSLAVATPGGVVPSRRGKLPSRCRGRGTGDVATHVLLPDAKCWGPFPRRSARHRRRPVAAGSSAPLVSDEPRRYRRGYYHGVPAASREKSGASVMTLCASVCAQPEEI